MCGIAGYYLREEATDRAALEEMARRLAHRGPDGHGFHAAGRVGLAHARLAIIDLSGGWQPLYNADRSLALVANGEIYNYVELRAELEALGHRFATHSDCETILHAYAAWGEACLDRLHGMFAFALHDTCRGELLLARDRLGIKPLYYTEGPRGLAFASEIKGLWPFLPQRRVNAAALAQFLQNNFTVAPLTLLDGVHKLPPGHLARIGQDGVTHLRRWWSPLAVQPMKIGPDEALRRFDTLMGEVVDIHLRSDVPFGLFLSGGVDSSLLAALIARRVNEPLRTLSVGFPGTSVHNELDAAAQVAARFGTRHTALQVTGDDLLARLPHAVWAADDLTGDYANLPVSLLAEQAGAEIKVVFSGEGGDEAFAGYGRYRVPMLKRLLAQWRYPGSGGFRTRGVFDRAPGGVCSPALTQAMAHWRAPFIEAWHGTPGDWTDLMRRQYVDLATWLPDDLLVKADRMLMAWGVEGRVPFLDHRVVEFGLALPDVLKVDARSGKRFLKQWGEQYLPHEHLWTRKKGFTVPVGEWLRGERLQRYAATVLQNPGVREWFNADAVQRLIAQHERNGRLAGPLWAILNFALWHRLFIEGDGTMPEKRQDPFACLSS